MTDQDNNLDHRIADVLDQETDATDGSTPAGDVNDSEESSHRAADAVLVHGLLRDLGRRDPERDEQRINAVMETIKAESQRELETVPPAKRSRRVTFVSVVAALAACLLLMLSFTGPNPANAALVSLEKIIEASKKSFDRSYRIFVVEEYDSSERPRNASPRDRRRHHDQIAGAVLHIRGPNEFVFVRGMTDGRQRISGCNGYESWAFREDGPVRVSSDLNRFRSGLPGREQDLPFVNLQSHLQQLRVGYDIELTGETVESSDGWKLSQLTATRKSSDVRGPVSVAVWFDTETGVVYEMLLDQLPRRGGGPKSVRLELLNPEDLGQTDFGPKFFSHDSHHEPLREIVREDR